MDMAMAGRAMWPVWAKRIGRAMKTYESAPTLSMLVLNDCIARMSRVPNSPEHSNKAGNHTNTHNNQESGAEPSKVHYSAP